MLRRYQRPSVASLLSVQLLLLALTSARAPAQQASAPTFTGPIASQKNSADPSRGVLFYWTPMDLARFGFVEQEYFVSGTSTRYSIPPTPTEASIAGTMPYRTRIVVRRPQSAKNFKGVVVVDWQNVSAGHDVDSEWSLAGQFFVRAGWAWVGASVQRAGVHGLEAPALRAGGGLKQWNASRYGSLDVTNGGTVTDDSQAFDIYSQIARALKQPNGVDPFDGMKVERVYAGGVSQSATYLSRYYNSVHPLTRVYDGFLLGLGGIRLRLDLPTKLLKIATENDVWRGLAALRVPDGEAIHTWEIAGAAHVGSDMMARDPRDFRGVLGALQDREKLPPPPPSRCTQPFPSSVETWAVFSAGYAALDRWVTSGVKPPTAAPIVVSAAPSSVQLATIVRDVHGIAEGGIRLPKVAVPTALLTGENLPVDPKNPGYCNLFGANLPFDAAKLKTLYPSRSEYGVAVQRVVDDLVQRGFVLKEDAPELIRNAENDLK